ncbi:MAG TPA: sigma 54-interacting transcriptional regulator [Pyrinomonadaceae bacterium]|jgi:DNA-binding NtrC family response regulator
MPEYLAPGSSAGVGVGFGFGLDAAVVIEARPLNMPRPAAPGLVGVGAAFRSMVDEVAKVAPWHRVSVVLTGATGTGKSAIARAIHEMSPRAQKPFVALNCATIGADLFESELFGHERGAFTGAHARKLGLMEQADGGTLFLDEIGELPLPLQAKLLLALENKSFRRVGGDKEITADVRIISATNRDLGRLVEEGGFRQDLRARLGSYRICVPTLAERREDVPALLAHYLDQFAPHFSRPLPYTLEPGALEVLVNCDWPDNVRQLRSVAERLALEAADAGNITAALARRVALSLGAAPDSHRPSPAPLAPLAPPHSHTTIPIPPYVVGEPIEDYEARVLLALRQGLLEHTGHNVGAVAESLHLSARALQKRLARARRIAGASD